MTLRSTVKYLFDRIFAFLAILVCIPLVRRDRIDYYYPKRVSRDIPSKTCGNER